MRPNKIVIYLITTSYYALALHVIRIIALIGIVGMHHAPLILTTMHEFCTKTVWMSLEKISNSSTSFALPLQTSVSLSETLQYKRSDPGS